MLEMLKTQRRGRVLPVRHLGEPCLRKPSARIEGVTDEIRQLAEDMYATMQDEDGIGLAAPQVGVNLRMVLLNVFSPVESADRPLGPLSPGERMLLPRMPLVLINPELSEFSEQTAEESEGCLSVPRIWAPVARSEYATLSTRLLDGETVSCRCGGMLARCLQHELDHLDGVLFIDHVVPDELAKVAGEIDRLRERTRKELRKRKRR